MQNLPLIKLLLISGFILAAFPINRTLAAPPSSPDWIQSNYWFRDDNGNETGATGLANGEILKGSAVSVADSNDYGRKRVFRLRIGFRVQQADGDIKPRLEFKESQTIDCAGTSGWQAIGVAGDATRYILRDSLNLTNATLTTQQITGGKFVSGKFLDTENPPIDAQTLAKNNRTEYEWSVEDTTLKFTPDKNYIFRVTDNGTPFTRYLQCPAIHFSKITVSQTSQPTEIKFSGQAYPESRITIFAKRFDEEIPLKQEEIVSPTGKFNISFTGILQSNYNYSLIISDKEGRNSQVKSYNLNVYSNSLNAKDIFAPPTLGISRAVITKGDFLHVSGYAGPGNAVDVEIDNRAITGKTKADNSGRYKWLVNTAGLEFGNHKVRARQSDEFVKTSEWSPTTVFVISELINPKTDFNNDGIVNINDWSVFLSRYSSKSEELKKQIDLNGDGKINISDFSMFIRTLKL